MFCNRPDLAGRYPKQMYEELTNVIFDDSTRETVFYAACVTMYRFNLLVSNSTVPQNMKRFKWHLLPLVRSLVSGSSDVLPLNSKNVQRAAENIIAVMGQHGQPATDIFTTIVGICQSLGEVSSDRLKRQAILTEMLAVS
jgi:hypothetical protein